MTARADDLGPAVAVCLSALGFVLGANAVLIRLGFRPVTDVARTLPGRMFRLYTELHFERLLGPADAYNRAARLIRRPS